MSVFLVMYQEKSVSELPLSSTAAPWPTKYLLLSTSLLEGLCYVSSTSSVVLHMSVCASLSWKPWPCFQFLIETNVCVSECVLLLLTATFFTVLPLSTCLFPQVSNGSTTVCMCVLVDKSLH